jgi:hypothetical protein
VLAVAALIALASCKDEPATGLQGTYEGTATGYYQLAGGKRVELTLPNETVVITATSHHYQGYTYRTVVRGCELSGDGTATGAAASPPPGKTTCTFDLPTVGPVTIAASGGVTMKGDRVHLSIGTAGGDGGVEELAYIFDAQPK